jgi:CheY-like chemotaxis protein
MHPYQPAAHSLTNLDSVPSYPLGKHCNLALSDQKRVLLVDDEPAVRDIVARMLDALGFSVVMASSGEEALMLLQAGLNSYSFVLSDLSMPRMSGSSLAGYVSRLCSDLPVLIMSGSASMEFEALQGEPGRSHFIQKPFTQGQLQETLSLLGVAR